MAKKPLKKNRSKAEEIKFETTRKKYVHHTPNERKSIVFSYLCGNLSQADCARTHHISRATLNLWLRQHRLADEKKKTENVALRPDNEKSTASERIRKLEQALADAELKNLALETLINVAERELGIDIRKKSGSKPSRK